MTVLNLNIGILGHVDSGKTSLAKVLSHVASTAAFDKNPQSQQRGITLDLGFSSFTVPMPEHLKSYTDCDTLQYTLVDCPGHASLIKTIIGGAQIIDFMLLVIDINKGIQTQTAECLVIGELTCEKMIAVLNKIDLIEESKRNAVIEKMKKKISNTLSQTKFKNISIVSVSAQPEANEESQPIGIEELINTILKFSFVPKRSKNDPFLFAVDHCFLIKGQGTVMTGTVLQGSVSINDTVEIPRLKITKKVKSMQMFKKPVQSAMQGDRLGICVTQFDSSQLERGIISAPGLMSLSYMGIIHVKPIKYFKYPIKSKSKFHISIGHETVMAGITLFSSTISEEKFNVDQEYRYEDELILNDNEETCQKQYFALLEFEKPVLTLQNNLLFGSKLDIDIHSNVCRIAFWGNILKSSDDKNFKETFYPKLKIYKTKTKFGIIDRLINDYEIVVKNLFKKGTNIHIFLGLKVKLSTGEIGKIESAFGQSGKVKIVIADGIKEQTQNILRKKSTSDQSDVNEHIQIILEFKKYIFDSTKKIIQ